MVERFSDYLRYAGSCGRRLIRLHTVFVFLLKSSGAIVLFVYVLIALSQIVLRRRTAPARLPVKMWFFPTLSILTLAGMIAVLVQMLFDDAARTQLWLSLLCWTVVLALYFVPGWWGRPAKPPVVAQTTGQTERVLILANEDLTAKELFDAVHRVDSRRQAEYFICVPANPIVTGQAENTGPVYLWDATLQAAQQRLGTIVTALRNVGLRGHGEVGDERPMHALADAVERFRPDQLVIAEDRSTWLRLRLAQRARAAYPIPVIQVLSGEPAAELARETL